VVLVPHHGHRTVSITFSDELTARMCPHCYAIPCRCSQLLRGLEWLIRALERIKQARYDARQRHLRG
jgi:hypothetical protein